MIGHTLRNLLCDGRAVGVTYRRSEKPYVTEDSDAYGNIDEVKNTDRGKQWRRERGPFHRVRGRSAFFNKLAVFGRMSFHLASEERVPVDGIKLLHQIWILKHVRLMEPFALPVDQVVRNAKGKHDQHDAERADGRRSRRDWRESASDGTELEGTHTNSEGKGEQEHNED